MASRLNRKNRVIPQGSGLSAIPDKPFQGRDCQIGACTRIIGGKRVRNKAWAKFWRGSPILLPIKKDSKGGGYESQDADSGKSKRKSTNEFVSKKEFYDQLDQIKAMITEAREKGHL